MRKIVLVGLLLGLAMETALAGDVTGQVRLETGLRKVRMGKRKVLEEARYQGDYAAAGRLVEKEAGQGPDTSNELAYVVLELIDPQGRLKATPVIAKTPGRNVLTQHNKAFEPHVLVVVRGSRVYFTNDDGIYHHIYSPANSGNFEIPRYIGKDESHVFSRGGPAELFCGIHCRMNAYIYVAESDKFALGPEHGFRIRDVPPGDYLLRVWHPRIPVREIPIKVSPDGLKVDVSL